MLKTLKHGNGFMHYQIDSLNELSDFASHVSDDMGFVFRGHADSDWILDTSLDRLFKRIKPEHIDLRSTHDFILSEFVKSIRGRTNISKLPDGNQDELWALGQHNGLATPLLDWSASLYVALFFAFENPYFPTSGYRSIWAIHRSCIQKKMDDFNEKLDYRDKFTFIDPITDHISRLISQSGIFTKQPLDFDLPSWVENQFTAEKTAYLFKIDIANSERLKILRQLRQMNIHHGSLFPDLLGASKFCNDTLELFADKQKRSVNSKFTAKPT